MHMISAILTCINAITQQYDDPLKLKRIHWRPVIICSRGAGDEVTSTSPIMRGSLSEEIKAPPLFYAIIKAQLVVLRKLHIKGITSPDS